MGTEVGRGRRAKAEGVARFGSASPGFCIAEPILAYRYLARTLRRPLAALLGAASLALGAGTAVAQGAPASMPVPPSEGRLHAADIGLVVNVADPYSVAVGAHYARARGLTPAQVLQVDLPLTPRLDRDTFLALREQIDRHFGSRVQALALAWVQPFAVACNSLTGALALGLDMALCRRSCAASWVSPYFNAASARPFAEMGFRLSMLLAAPDVEQAKALIDRGVAADASLRVPARGRPPASVMLLQTEDPARRVRMRLYPEAGLRAGPHVDIRIEPAAALAAASRVLLVSTGEIRPDLSAPIDFLPGALADHLTSLGGVLAGGHRHGTALDWIGAGATASHGSVSEPCNHVQKFPHPQVLLQHYLQGSTAIEAYWKSVAWPQQSLFVGEPLAAPFAVP